MVLTYSDILAQNVAFQRAINLSMDQGRLQLVDSYIPTTASASILARFLLAAIQPGADRASILIGPYGKGKSHTLFVAMSVLSEQGAEAESVFARLAERLELVNRDAANLVRRIRNDAIRLLPVVVNDRYLDIRQAFLASLRTALQTAGLTDIMPDNYFQRCLETISRWKKEYPNTHADYVHYLRTRGEKPEDFEAKLRQFDASALSIFRDCHQAILSGTTFDPLLESDAPTLYHFVAEALRAKGGWNGLFVVFDEFGKYLESAESGGDRFKALQDLAEMCSRSNETCLMLTCISHKAISEYATNLNQTQRISFRTVEGRFQPIYFTTTFEGSFSLIAGALGRNQTLYQQFIDNHKAEQSATVAECAALGCFAGYEHSVEEIVSQCFPMHPLTTLALMKLSEQAAQNERTLFTFLSGEDSPLSFFIRENNGEYKLATVPMVYDYFHVSIRENTYDRELRDTIIHADSLIPSVDRDEKELVKAVVLFSMVADNCLLATHSTLLASLQWDSSRLDAALRNLEQRHYLYTRRSDGVICLMRSTTENVRRDIEQETARRGRIDIADQLTELHDPGFTIPRRYNDRFEMVRFFRNVYVSPERFMRQRNADFLIEEGFADGYVIYLLGVLPSEEVQRVLQGWNDPRITVLLPSRELTAKDAIMECAAILHLMAHPSDEVAAEELGYYYEDMLQVVNQACEAMFQQDTLLITMTTVSRCDNLSADISALCEQTLYPACPVICHEMINRSTISGQMKQTRAKVIDTVLTQQDFLTVFPLKTSEGPVVRSVLGHLQEKKARDVIEVIQGFLASCEVKRQPLSSLYQQLMSSPYGMRQGVLPILLAYCLRNDHRRAVLYNHAQELPITGENLSALDEHVADYELLVDRGSADQTAYIHALHDQYTPSDPVPDIRSIYESLCREVRAMPRSARANRTLLTAGEVKPISPTSAAIRSVLIRFDGNARDVLLHQLPKAMGMPANKECAQAIIGSLKDMDAYTKRLIDGMKHELRQRLGAQGNQTVRGMITVYMQQQSATRLNHSYSGSTASLLNVFRSHDNHTDTEWMNLIAVALTGLPVEDWSDRQVEEFAGALDGALREIESIPTDYDANDGSSIRLSLGGLTLEQPLPITELEGMASVAYDSVRSALSEFGDSITTDEKILILANLMLHINS